MTLRVARILRAPNWKYAAGEFVLIVVGILVALGLDAWRSERSARREELASLQEIRSSLVADLELFKVSLDTFRSREARMVVLQEHLDEGLPYSDSLDAYFGAVIRFSISVPNRSAYEVLKNHGLNLVTNDSLRAQLAYLYDQQYVEMALSGEDDRNVVLEVVRPYFMTAFQDVRFGVNATPLDPVRVMTDPLLRNIVTYRLNSLRFNAIGDHVDVIQSAEAVLEGLNRELRR